MLGLGIKIMVIFTRGKFVSGLYDPPEPVVLVLSLAYILEVSFHIRVSQALGTSFDTEDDVLGCSHKSGRRFPG
jgi:hypothetical protein